MALRIVQVDAFTARPFAGNPAAVCVLATPRPDDWLQAVAREMNLSETAFLVPEEDGYRLRWFTPQVEVDLCGHATLASAHVLWEDGLLEPSATARFHTRSGLLTASLRESWIDMDFPARPPTAGAAPDGLLEALGVEARWVGRNQDDYLVEVATTAAVRAARPDFGRLAQVRTRGVILTARDDTGEFDFVSRFFAPAVGVDEDPVTGSAHTCLAPYWRDRLDKEMLLAFQVSTRGGVVRMRLGGDRVILSGQAVTVLRGEIVESATAPPDTARQ